MTFKVGDRVRLTGGDWPDTGLDIYSLYVVRSVNDEENGWAVIDTRDGWMVDPRPGQAFSAEIVPTETPKITSEFDASVTKVLTQLKKTLLAKNEAYGNSALEPVRVFSTSDRVEQLRVRIDDKLSRLKSSLNDDNEDTVLDLMGYLVLLRIATRKQD